LPLRWFRRRKAEEAEQAPSEAAAPPVSPPEHDGSPVAGAAAESTTTRKRRRGSRGGVGRKRKPGEAAPAAETGAAPVDEDDAAPAPKRGERKRTRDTDRKRPPRRQPPRRAPLPKAKRELLVSVDAGEKRVAMLEDDVVAEVYLERPEHRSIAGNVYLGIVDNVLPGMEAAFVEIGLEKNGFLYVDEIVGPELEGRRGARKIQDLIQRGQTIVVQAVKDPMKTKGARLTTEISLPGRFVVYVPHGDGLGVSRRLDDDERARLKGILKEIAPKQGGVIVRTAAEGASAEDVERDLTFLMQLWKTIEKRAKSSKGPALVYQEAELPLRVTRDLFTGDFERLVVDHDRTHRRIVGYLKKTSPHMVERVTRYKERAPLMEASGVEGQIKSTLNRRVDLPSGGYLIFDYAEAFTVIDVNTGRFVGSRSKTSGARLEDTITKNNLEAVKEVVRQLRLRDIGGIIVIDFIDMANPKNRQTVEDALRQELERDRTKTYVVEISPLGLVEMTRQNVTDGPREVMTRKCPTCGGDGIVVSESTTAVELERKLRSLVTPGSRAKAYKVELNAKIASMLAGPGGSRIAELEELTKKRFLLVGLEDVHLDHFRVLGQGTVEKLAPEAPVAVGQELDLKLGEVGLHDPNAGVGKVDGYDIAVGAAAKLVGKKVRVRITAVMDGIGYAERVGADEVERPITAEAEAERPTRARRSTKSQEILILTDEELEETVAAGDEEPPAKPPRKRSRKPAAPVAEVADETAEAEAPPRSRKQKQVEAEAEAEAEPVADEGVEAEGSSEPAEDGESEGAAPKKRTRRGTRGGRNRRRKPSGAESSNGAGPPEAQGDSAHDGETAEGEPAHGSEPAGGEPAEGEHPGELPAPVIHVPERDLGSGEEHPEPEEHAADEAPSENGAEGAPSPAKRRRGTRGGRGRKRKPAEAEAAGGAATATVAESETGIEPPVSNEAPDEERDRGDWTYTPMSEWGDLDADNR
jgi:ribonuclease G